MMLKYEVISRYVGRYGFDSDLREFTTRVNNALKEDWVPLGPVQIATNTLDKGLHYNQTLTKECS